MASDAGRRPAIGDPLGGQNELAVGDLRGRRAEHEMPHDEGINGGESCDCVVETGLPDSQFPLTIRGGAGNICYTGWSVELWTELVAVVHRERGRNRLSRCHGVRR